MIKNLLLLWFIFFCLHSVAKKSIFVYCSEGSPSFFNPQIASDGTTFDVTGGIYNRLLEFKRGTADIQPALAESWEVSEDGLQYTFRLRKDVSFHTIPYFTPTRKFNADDVLFSFNRALDKKHPYHLVSGGKYFYFNDMGLMDLVQQIVKLDPSTVRFDLKKPSATFLTGMAMQFAVILSKEYADQLRVKKTESQIDQKPIGTGPFVFSNYSKDSLIRFKVNPNYFQEVSDLDGMVFAITPDASVRFQKLKREECHLMSFPSPTDYESIDQHKKLKLLKEDAYNVAYLAMNVEKPPLNNLQVRQAIRHALNRSLYVKAIYLGHAQVAKGPLPPKMWSYNSKIKDYEYNIKKAKQLLKQAGHPEGFEIRLWTLPVSRPYNPSGKKMGELMQQDLAQVGIKVQLVNYDWTTFLKKAAKGEHELIQLGWTGDNGDPDNFLNVLLSCASVKSGSNVARWCNPEYDQLI